VSTASDRVSAVSLVVLMQAFMSFDQLLLFAKDRDLFLHESSTGLYTTSTFFWSRCMAELPTHTLCGFFCAVICHAMFGFQDGADKLVCFYMIMVMVTNAGAALMTLLGALAPDMDSANALSFIVIPLMVVDGNWVNKDNIPDWLMWLEKISFMGLAVNGATVIEFRGLEFTCPEVPEGDYDVCVERTGEQFLEELGMEDVDPWTNIWLLFLHYVVYRILALLALHFLFTGQSFSERLRLFVGAGGRASG